MGLTDRRRVFIEEYLQCWNATEAARRAGFSHPNKQGPRLLVNVGIQAAKEARIAEKAMSADEVLLRLADQARGDIGDFMDIESMSFDLNLQKAKEKGLTHLIKKAKQRTVTTVDKSGEETETNVIELELYDSQGALVQLGRHHGLFTDKTDLTTKGEPIKIIEVIKDYGNGGEGEQ